MNKFHELTIDISAVSRQNITTNTTFFTMDVATAKKYINFTLNGEPLDLTTAKVLIGFDFVNNQTSKIIDSTDGSVLIADAKVGRVELKLPNDIYAYSGQVLVHTYILFADGRSFDAGVVVTEFEESWLDQELAEMGPSYIKRFEDLARELQAKIDAIGGQTSSLPDSVMVKRILSDADYTISQYHETRIRTEEYVHAHFSFWDEFNLEQGRTVAINFKPIISWHTNDNHTSLPVNTEDIDDLWVGFSTWGTRHDGSHYLKADDVTVTPVTTVDGFTTTKTSATISLMDEYEELVLTFGLEIVPNARFNQDGTTLHKTVARKTPYAGIKLHFIDGEVPEGINVWSITLQGINGETPIFDNIKTLVSFKQPLCQTDLVAFNVDIPVDFDTTYWEEHGWWNRDEDGDLQFIFGGSGLTTVGSNVTLTKTFEDGRLTCCPIEVNSFVKVETDKLVIDSNKFAFNDYFIGLSSWEVTSDIIVNHLAVISTIGGDL